MKILVKEVGKKPRIADIPNELDEMKKIVDGYIEVVPTVVDGVVLVCDEEGKLKKKPFNFFCADEIVGDVFFASVNGAEFTDITDGQAKKIVENYFR